MSNHMEALHSSIFAADRNGVREGYAFSRVCHFGEGVPCDHGRFAQIVHLGHPRTFSNLFPRSPSIGRLAFLLLAR